MFSPSSSDSQQSSGFSWGSLNLSFTHFPGVKNFKFLFIGAFVGVLGGFGAILFRETIELVKTIVYRPEQLNVFPTEAPLHLGYIFFLGDLPFWRMWLLPCGIALLIGAITWHFREDTRGSGVPDLLESTSLGKGKISWKIFPAKYLVSSLSLGTIASLGREGPIVHIGSSLGSLVTDLFKIPRKRWKLVSACGGASGLAATFNTPFAGAFFFAEVVLGSFSIDYFAPVVIASVSGTAVGQTYFGDQSAFQIDVPFRITSGWELGMFAILGVSAGVFALLVIHLSSVVRQGGKQLPIPNVIKPVLGALSLVCIAYFWSPHAVGVGYESIDALIGNATNPPEGFISKTTGFLAVILLAKLLAVCISLGSGFSGGLFSPGLFMGATLGYIVGIGVNEALSPELVNPPEAYALIGMGTLYSGMAKAPITSILIILEMTRDYRMILPLMIGCILSTVITRLISRDSIYTIKLTERGTELHRSPEELIMHRMTVQDVMRRNDIAEIHPDTPLKTVFQEFLKHRTDHLFVTDQDDILKGEIGLHQIRDLQDKLDELGEEIVAGDIMEEYFPVLTPDDPLTEAMDQFWEAHHENIAVVESEEHPKFLGYVYEHDVIGVYNREVLKDPDTLFKLVHEEEEEEVTDYLELPEGYHVDQLPVQNEWTGKTLKDLHFRENEHLMVLEIKRKHSPGNVERIADVAEEPLQEGDQLVVIGPKEEIEEEKEQIKKSM